MTTAYDTWAAAGPTRKYEQWVGHDRLLYLTFGGRITQVVYTLAKLNVADTLREGPRSAAEIAEITGSDPDALLQVLRASAAVGLFEETPDEKFRLTTVSHTLRTDVEDSLRDLILFQGDELLWQPLGHLDHTVRTGRPSFEHVYGRPFYEHLTADSHAAGRFEKAMVQRSELMKDLYSDLDFTPFHTIADLGGGRGHFLARVLQRTPAAKGILFDRAAVAAEAVALLAEYGVADRTEVVSGSFFTGVPEGADAYILEAVLHEWRDDDAVAILRQVRAAIGDRPGARVFILDKLLNGRLNAFDYGKLLCLDMLVHTGGRDRALADWLRLIDAGGFELDGEPPSPERSPWVAFVCRPK
ncbi:methyltransferase [Sinosporangium siamense]|uniref:Methyltransferase n=1 Tax=Sinosporangium siamense TaxID=1367973 RepID=A0A919V939_9ACTN|nr:methyltransferase [Sinosporangium siamense]GII95058.1 methyltransferase [Sinosporangium siamense]